LGELARGLAAAEGMLNVGGCLAVVAFHSLEDRIVKRFLTARTGKGGRKARGTDRSQKVLNRGLKLSLVKRSRLVTKNWREIRVRAQQGCVRGGARLHRLRRYQPKRWACL